MAKTIIAAHKPEGMQELDFEMTNFDGSIDKGFAEALQLKPERVFGRHHGWNFCGVVWFGDGQFHEAVYAYNCQREIISTDTLPKLMKAVNAIYGSD